MNLALNARDAMPNGGKLTLETTNAQLDSAYASEHQPTAPGRYVMLAVSDTGDGMSAEVQARIFEPFFTTKEVGKGTGLGLATVYGIVKQSGGYIWVYSEPGHGTMFKVYLAPAEFPLVAQPAPRDAESAVRALAREVLRRYGYVVLEARHGVDALRVTEHHPDDIHLMITDVVMP